MNNNVTLRGLPKRLVTDGLLSEDQARGISEHCDTQKTSIVQHLVESEILPAYLTASVASHEFGLALYDLDAHNFDNCPKGLVQDKLLNKHQALPLFTKGNRLFLALSDPTNQHGQTEIRFQTGLSIEPVLVEHDKLVAGLDRFFAANDQSLDDAFSDMDDVNLEDLDIESTIEDDDEGVVTDADDAPVVRYINKMLLDAIKRGASDIHFEPYEKYYRVRFRTDGILEVASTPPNNLAPRLAARLKVMSQMDISERRVPQDGRIKLKISKNKSIDFRVNTLPTLYGEKIVLRILDSSQAKMGIDSLGYEQDQKEAYLHTRSNPRA